MTTTPATSSRNETVRLQDLYRKGIRKDHKTNHVPVDTTKLIGFKLANEEFVIEIERVKEIIKIPIVTRVSKSPPFVEGISNMRGEILQILNFHKILNLPSVLISPKSRVIVIDSPAVLAGIIVDSVAEVIEVDNSAIQLAPDIIAGENGKFIKGIIKDDSRRSILWIDISMIYSEYLGKTIAVSMG
jgi:purine-binding chemotaxis protein CheW